MATWMVVDDEPDIYDVLVTMFRLWGIEGVAFVDGTEAVHWIESVDDGTYTGELPEMAIIDIRLPGIEGHYVAARIRRSPRLGNMAIALITAYRISAATERYYMAISQADLLIEKPLPALSELREQLDAVIARRKARAPHYPALFPEAGPAPERQEVPLAPRHYGDIAPGDGMAALSSSQARTAREPDHQAQASAPTKADS
ncbi:MAG: response regulator [Aggregatilineaceae bacterium]